MITLQTKKILKKLIAGGVLGIVTVFSFSTTVVYAVDANTTQYVALTTIPGFTTGCVPVEVKDANGVVKSINTDNCVKTNPLEKIKNIYGVAIGIAAVLAVIMIIWAGLEYATTDAITGKSDAKVKWQGALYGLGLLLVSYLLLRTINIDLVNINLNLGTPRVGDLVKDNALADLVALAEVNSQAALQTAKTVQQQTKTATENIQSQIDTLDTQLKDTNLSATDRARLLGDHQYASALLNFRKSDQTIIDMSLEINNKISNGVSTDLSLFQSTLQKEIDSLNATKNDNQLNTRLGNAIDQRIIILDQKLVESNRVFSTVKNENDVYVRAMDLYSKAKPSKQGMTPDQFLLELTNKQIYVSDQATTPVLAIKNIESGVLLKQPETSTILKTYGNQFTKGINSAIQKRVDCYAASTKQGATPTTSTGCNSF